MTEAELKAHVVRLLLQERSNQRRIYVGVGVEEARVVVPPEWNGVEVRYFKGKSAITTLG